MPERTEPDPTPHPGAPRFRKTGAPSPKPQAPRPGRAARLLDIGGLLLFLAGAAIYGWAWIGMRNIDEFEAASGAGPFPTVARMDELATLSRVGIGVMAAGALVALVAVVVGRRGRRDGGGSDAPE